MKNRSVLLYVIMLIVCVMTFALVPTSVHAQDGQLPIDRILNAILVIVIGFAALVGVSKLTAAIVSLLKFIPGLIQVGTADKWAAGLNLIFFVGLVAFRVFQPDISLEVLDGYAGQIATIAVFVLGFIVQMTGSKPTYDQLKEAGVPLIGKSNSG
jgi:hypothetical protein